MAFSRSPVSRKSKQVLGSPSHERNTAAERELDAELAQGRVDVDKLHVSVSMLPRVVQEGAAAAGHQLGGASSAMGH